MTNLPGRVLSIDVGSTSVKAATFSDGGQRSSAVTEVRHRRLAAGAAASTTASQVFDAVISLLWGLDLQQVEVVTLCGAWQTLVVDDRHGADPRLFTWETPWDEADVEKARTALARTWSPGQSGAWIHPSYPLLMAAGMPDELGSGEPVELLAWLIGRLTGTPVGWSETVASGSGMWNQNDRCWADAFHASGLSFSPAGPAMFDEPITARHPHPELPASLRDAKWLSPLPDGLCHNLGVSAVDEIIAVTAATSGSVRAVGDLAEIPPMGGFWRYRCGENTVAAGGAVTSMGNALEWVQSFTGSPVDWSFVLDEADSLPTLLSRPDVFGRRGPDYPTDASGSVVGLRPVHTAKHMAAAFAVDVWANIARFHRTLAEAVRIDTVRAGGGIIDKNPQAAQLLADALGHPVQIMDESQPVLRGAALFGTHWLASPADAPNTDVVVSGIRNSVFEQPSVSSTVSVRPEWHAALTERWAALPAAEAV